MKLSKFVKASKIVITVVYFALLSYIVFFAKRRREYNVRTLKLIPFQNNIQAFRNMDVNNKKDVYGFFINILGNIVLFVPLSIIFVVVFNFRSNRNVIVWAFLVSLTIEVMQFYFKAGVSDIDDILLNVLGAVIGVIILKIGKKHLRYLQQNGYQPHV